MKSAGDIQQAVANISTIKPEINTAGVTSSLEQMSTRVAQSSTQLADSLYNVFSSIDVGQADALRLTEQFARGAVAAQSDAESFGTAVLGVMNAYKLSASDAAHISDVFFTTVNRGVITGDQLAHNLGNVTQSAKNAGVSFDTLGALIAGVTKEGGEASVNVNNLNNVLQKIVTADVQQGLANLGIVTKDASGNFRDIVAVIGDLKGKLDQLSAGDRARVLQDLFPDAQARTGIQTLISQLGTVTDVAQENARAAGVASAAYDKMGATAKSQATILKNTLVATLSDFGALALPGLLSVAEAVQGLVHRLDDLSPATKQILVYAVEGAAGFGLLAAGANKVTGTLSDLGGSIRTVIGLFAAKEAAKKSLTAANNTLATSVGKTGSAFAGLTTSAGAATTATTLLVPALVALATFGGLTAVATHNANESLGDTSRIIGGDLGPAIEKLNFTWQDIVSQGEPNKIRAAVDAWAAGATAAVPSLVEMEATLKRINAQIDATNAKTFRGLGEESQKHQLEVTATELEKQIALIRELNRQSAIHDRYLTSEAQTEVTASVQRAAAAYAALSPNVQAVNAIVAATGGVANEVAGSLGFLSEEFFRNRDAAAAAQVVWGQLAAQRGLIDQFNAQSAAMQGMTSAASPMQAALDLINQKIAAGIPLTSTQAGLLGSLPGYIASATSGYDDLVVANAQTAIAMLNNSGAASTAGGALGGLGGQANALRGVLDTLRASTIQLEGALGALGTENSKLSGEYSILQARVDVLNDQKKSSAGLTAAEAAELATLQGALDKLAGQMGDNAARQRDLVLSLIDGADKTKVATGQFNDLQDKLHSLGTIAPEAGSGLRGLTDGFGNVQAAAGSLGSAITSTFTSAASSTQAAGLAAATAGIKYNEFGQAINSVPKSVNVIATTNAVEAAGQVSGLKIAAELVPKTVTTTASTNAARVAGEVAGLQIAIALVPKSFTITANVNIGPALSAIAELNANLPHSPAEKGPFKTLPNWGAIADFGPFADGIARAVDLVSRLGDAIDQGMAEAGKRAGEAVSSVAGAIKSSVDAIAALSGLKGLPSGAQTSGLLGFVANTTAQFSEVAAQFEEDALKATGSFADTASKVAGLVKSGIDAILALKDYEDPPIAAVHAFAVGVAGLVQEFGWVASQLAPDWSAAAAVFAESAGKVLGIVSNGVKAILDLQNYKGVAFDAVHSFATTVAAIVQEFGWVATFFQQEGLTAASSFAETASRVLGTIGTGISGLAVLGEVVDPSFAAIHRFTTTVAALVQEIGWAGAQFERDVLAAASTFATSAGSVVGIIGNATEGLSKLAEFVAPSQQAIDQFVYAVYATVRKIAEMAQQMSAEGIASAGAFGVAAGSVFAATKDALAVFGGFKDLVIPSAKAIDDLAIGVGYVVARMGAMGDEIGKTGLDHATKFGQSVQSVFSGLKSAMDTLTNLKKFKDAATDAFDSLRKGMQGAIDRAQGMVDQAKILKLQSEEYAALIAQAAANFAKGMGFGGGDPQEIGKKLGAGVVSGARDALDSHSPSQVMASIGRDITAGLALGLSQSEQEAAKAAADLAKSVADAVQTSLGAAKALSALKPTDLPSGAQVSGVLGFTSAIVAGVRQAAGDLSALASDEGARLNEAAGKWSDTAKKAVDLFSGGLDALAKLQTFVPPAQAAILAAGRALVATINDLAVVAETVTVESADLAGHFAEGATKSVALIGQGADAFLKLSGLTAPLAGVLQFGKAVEAAINDLALLAERIDGPTLDLAARFAEGVGKVAAIVGQGADGFRSLVGFQFTDAVQAGILQLDKAIMAAINDLAIVAETVTIDGADVAGRLAEGVGKVVGVIATAVEGFGKLDGFAYTDTIRTGILALGKGVKAIVADFATIADAVSVELADLAGRFAEGAGKVLAIVANGVTGFKALPDLVAPAAGSIATFVGATAELVYAVQGAARLFGADGLKAAADFADTAGKALGLLSNGVAGFKALPDLIAPSETSMGLFARSAVALVVAVQRAAAGLSGDGLKAASDFADAGGEVLSIVGNAVSGLKDLVTFVAAPQSAMDAFATTVRDMLATMARLAVTVATEGQDAASALAEAVGKVFGGLNQATSYFKSLEGLLLPDQAGIERLLAPILDTIAAVAAASRRIGAGDLTAAQGFSGVIGNVFASLEAANRSLSAPVPVTSTGGYGGGGTTNNYYITITDDGSRDLEDRVVMAIETAHRRGRI